LQDKDRQATGNGNGSPFVRTAVGPYRPAGPLERWGPGILICLITAAAYWPSYDNGFVSWDDDHYIYQNQQLIQPDGIKSGLFDVLKYSDPRYRGTREEDRVSHQYYPLVFGIYWVEFQVYKRIFEDPLIPDQSARGITFEKMNPDVAVGFHVVSVFFHCVCVFLLIALLRSLGLNTWVASVAAALFALTPVNVASVAWAAERKNILSMMFYMLALLSYLRFRRQGGWYWYVGCILLHQSALFSKTVSVTFPAMVVLTDRLIDRRWSGESLLRAAPLAIQSMIAAGITMTVEDRARSIPIEDAQRPLVAAAAIWFYVLKAVAPVGLLPIYPLWHPSWGEIRWLLPLLGLLGAGWLVWAFRRRISPYMFWAAALYLVTTAPMLGFKNINYFQFAFVADHYFYHGGIGLFVLIALVLDALRRRLGVPAARHALTGITLAGCLTFAGLTWARCDDWQDVESFWFKTITGDRSLRFDDWAGDDSFWAGKQANRNCWPAHYNLGNQAIRDAMAAVRESQTSDDPDARKAGRQTYTKKMEEASVLFAEAARAHRDADPNGRELWQAYEKWIEAEYHLARMDRIVQIGQKMVDHRAQSVAGYYYLGLARKAREEHDKAEWCFRNALRVPPRRDGDVQMQSLALYHLADIYTNIPEKQDLPQALRCLEEAVRLNPRNQRAEAARRQLQAYLEKKQD